MIAIPINKILNSHVVICRGCQRLQTAPLFEKKNFSDQWVCCNNWTKYHNNFHSILQFLWRLLLIWVPLKTSSFMGYLINEPDNTLKWGIFWLQNLNCPTRHCSWLHEGPGATTYPLSQKEYLDKLRNSDSLKFYWGIRPLKFNWLLPTFCHANV